MAETHYDVIVVGLGAMGSATLYQLAQRGLRVLGVDQFAPPHQLGSTHGETRITRLAIGEGAAYMPLVRRTHAIWRELEAQTGETLLTQSGGYIIGPRSGNSHFHGQGDFVAQTAQLASAYNIDHAVRDAAEIRSHLPQVIVQEDEYGCFETTGGVVNPEQAVTVQLRLAQQLGATVRLNTKVIALETGANGVALQTADGRVSADKVVVSAGAWIRDFVPAPVGQPFAVYRQVFYWFEAEDLSLFRPAHFPWLLWIRQRQEDFYSVFPAPEEATPAVKMVTEEYIEDRHPDDVRRTVTSAEIEHMYTHFVQNRIEGVTDHCLQAHVCLYTVTPDEHFVIDWHPESEHVLLVSPCSGHGFKHSAAIGEAVAQLIADGRTAYDLRPFALDRFSNPIG